MEPFVERLLVVGSALRLRPGEVLFTEGDASDDVYVIGAGRLLVTTAAGLGVTLGPGEIVGELAAVTGARRTATVSAGEESEVVVVSAAAFESELSRIPAAAEALGEEAVRRLDRTLFMNLLTTVTGPLSSDVVAEIEEGAEWLRLPMGSLLFRAGDPADAAYLVLSGRVSVERETPEGGTVPIEELGPGELVGELGIVDSAPRTVGVRARRDTTLVRLERSVFESLLPRYPAVMLQVGRMVLGRAAGVRPEVHALTVALAGSDESFRERFVAETGCEPGDVDETEGAVDDLPRTPRRLFVPAGGEGGDVRAEAGRCLHHDDGARLPRRLLRRPASAGSVRRGSGGGRRGGLESGGRSRVDVSGEPPRSGGSSRPPARRTRARRAATSASRAMTRRTPSRLRPWSVSCWMRASRSMSS